MVKKYLKSVVENSIPRKQMTYQTDGCVTVQHRANPDAKPASLPKNLGRANWPISPEEVLKSFNTRAFKREQPDNPTLLRQSIAEALARHEPVSFALYWGKGLRAALAAPEFACLDYLASMISRVTQGYKHGAKVTLIFTDTHASLNGHSRDSIRMYFADLTLAARQRTFDVCLLSALIDDAADLCDASGPEPQVPSDDLLSGLSASAAKWFKGAGTPREGAIRYYQANMLEKRVVERAFQRSIFVTFNSSKFRVLLPDRLPIFYMFSVQHGVSDKPWFLPGDSSAQQEGHRTGS
jgi:hypothetical protein